MQPTSVKSLDDVVKSCNLSLKHTADRTLDDYRDIIDFRNLLAHGYDLVNHARVWQVIQESLPLLKVEVEQLLSEAGSQS